MKLRCTSGTGGVFEYPGDGQLQTITDLLANGTNIKLTLTKSDGTTYTYELLSEPTTPQGILTCQYPNCAAIATGHPEVFVSGAVWRRTQEDIERWWVCDAHTRIWVGGRGSD